jgi:hypothetical protein
MKYIQNSNTQNFAFTTADWPKQRNLSQKSFWAATPTTKVFFRNFLGKVSPKKQGS